MSATEPKVNSSLDALAWLDLTHPDGIIELRILDAEIDGGELITVSGWYDADHRQDLLRDAQNWTLRAAGCYASMNPVNPKLLSRSKNKVGRSNRATKDVDIEARRMIVFDLDPERPPGVMATNDEKALAELAANHLDSELFKRAWPEPIRVDSGSGYHLEYPIDLPADDHGLVERVLQAAAAMLKGHIGVKLDTVLSNASRIIRLPGTMNRKGSHDPVSRPHRECHVISLPATRTVVSEAALEAFASEFEKVELEKVELAPEPARTRQGGMKAPVTGYQERLDAFVRKAIEDECSAVSGAPNGDRNIALNKAAYNLGQLVGAKVLARSEAETALEGAAAGLTATDGIRGTRKTIKSGMDEGEKVPRDLSHLGQSGSNGKVETNGPLIDPTKPPEFSGPPRLIEPTLLPVPEFDPDLLLPDGLRLWVKDIAERGCFPIEYAAAAAIVSLGSLLGRRLVVRPRRLDNWLEPANVWGMAIGPSGIQKTPPVSEAMRPLRKMERDAAKEHRALMEEYEVDAAVREADRQAAKKDLAKSAQKGHDVDVKKAKARAAAGMPGDDPPAEKRFIVHDTTVEKLGEILAENPWGLLQYRDELIGFLRSFDKRGFESARAAYLEWYVGMHETSVDRISRGTLRVPPACVSVFGTVTPGGLSRFMADSQRTVGVDGMFSRFGVMVYPDIVGEFVNNDRTPDAGARNAAEAVYDRAKLLTAARHGCNVDLETGLAYAQYAPDAQDFFDGWRVDLETTCRSGSLGEVLTAHISKYRKLMPALSLIVHFASLTGEEVPAITLLAAKRAAAWCSLLLSHAKRIYHHGICGNLDGAATLATRLKRGDVPNPFTCRVVAQKGWSALSSVDEVRRAVGILEDRNWLKLIEVPSSKRGGRPSEAVWVNPEVQADCGDCEL